MTTYHCLIFLYPTTCYPSKNFYNLRRTAPISSTVALIHFLIHINLYRKTETNDDGQDLRPLPLHTFELTFSHVMFVEIPLNSSFHSITLRVSWRVGVIHTIFKITGSHPWTPAFVVCKRRFCFFTRGLPPPGPSSSSLLCPFRRYDLLLLPLKPPNQERMILAHYNR